MDDKTDVERSNADAEYGIENRVKLSRLILIIKSITDNINLKLIEHSSDELNVEFRVRKTINDEYINGGDNLSGGYRGKLVVSYNCNNIVETKYVSSIDYDSPCSELVSELANIYNIIKSLNCGSCSNIILPKFGDLMLLASCEPFSVLNDTIALLKTKDVPTSF